MMATARHGFTLMEVLIAIVVMGILTTVGVSNYLDGLDNAKNSEVGANVNVVRLALENYASDNDGNYPSGSTAASSHGWNGTISTDHSGLTSPAFHGAGYLQANQLPLAPWCKQPQSADVPDDLLYAPWTSIVAASNQRAYPTQWPQTNGRIDDPPNSDASWGVIRYFTGSTARALAGPASVPNSTKVYYMFGVGKRGSKRCIVAAYTNTLQ